MDLTLQDQISNSRTDYMNGRVVYDLTTDVDFSHPKETGKALAKVLFERDVSRWINDREMEVNPTSRLEILIRKGNDKKVQKAMKETTNDLKYEEILKHYKTQIDTVANAYLQARSKYYWVVYSATNARVAKKEMDEEALQYALKKLTSKVFASITITSV